jgi:plasmid stabilization system protein ParE
VTRIVWAAAARRDLAAHIAYIARDDPDAADRVEEAILEAVDGLADFPFRGRPGRRIGTRELVVAAFPTYIVVYTASESQVGIARVLHSRQAWPR